MTFFSDLITTPVTIVMSSMMSLASLRILCTTPCTSPWSKIWPPCYQSWPRLIARPRGKSLPWTGLNITCPNSTRNYEESCMSYTSSTLISLDMTQETQYAKTRLALCECDVPTFLSLYQKVSVLIWWIKSSNTWTWKMCLIIYRLIELIEKIKWIKYNCSFS